MGKTGKPGKQRARLKSMSLFGLGKELSAHLSKALRAEIGKRALPVRTGDKVKVMRGSNKGRSGKITAVDKKRQRLFIEGITRKKADGKEVQIPIKASNTMVVELERTDEKRLKSAKQQGKEKADAAALQEPKEKKAGKQNAAKKGAAKK